MVHPFLVKSFHSDSLTLDVDISSMILFQGIRLHHFGTRRAEARYPATCKRKAQKKASDRLPACLPVCKTASLPVCLPVCLPACLPACLPVCLSVCRSLSLSFSLSLVRWIDLSNKSILQAASCPCVQGKCMWWNKSSQDEQSMYHHVSK